MGCPVVSLQSHPGIGSFGSAILKPLGLEDWVAHTEEEYVQIAVQKAASADELTRLRSELRSIIMNSPFCDERGLVKSMENAYFEMWQRWVVQAITK